MFRATTRLGVTLALACGLVVGTSGVSEAAPRMSLRRGGLPAVRTPALRFRGSMIAPALRQRFPSPGQVPIGRPFIYPNPALYAGGPTLAQFAYNAAVLGRAYGNFYGQIPPYALGYNPYPSPVLSTGMVTTPYASYGGYYPYDGYSPAYGGYTPYSHAWGDDPYIKHYESEFSRPPTVVATAPESSLTSPSGTASAEKKASTAPQAQAATLTVEAPADAEVQVDDQPLNAAGAVHDYKTGPLYRNLKYRYKVEARWRENGHTRTQTRNVDVSGGDHVTVRFPLPSGPNG